MPVDPNIRDAYRRGLQRVGQKVTFIGYVGVAPNVTQTSATVLARVMDYSPEGPVVGRTDFPQSKLGAITQGDRMLIVLDDDLAAKASRSP